MKKSVSRVLGFTLIEMMVVVAIIGILIALAVPSYRYYTRKAHYVEVIEAISPYKIALEACFQATGRLLECQPGVNGVPMEVLPGDGAGLVDSIRIAESGKIVVTPRAQFGILASQTYELTPLVVSGGVLRWESGGGGVIDGYAN